MVARFFYFLSTKRCFKREEKEYVRSTRGQANLEFALTFPLFALLSLAVVEFSHLFYAELTLQQALREAGRYMVTGQTGKDINGNDMPRPEAIDAVFKKWLIGTGTGLQSLALTCGGSVCNPPGGGPGDKVTLTATFCKPLFTVLFARLFPGGGGCPPGNFSFTLSTTWKNEPFS